MEVGMSEIAQRLDARGMNCPLPILKTRQAINRLASGQILEITATDPGSLKDMAAFCDQTGNHLLASNTAGEGFVFLIKKA
jgi:tRNA 2-thiouridine synthesizing protein A